MKKFVLFVLFLAGCPVKTANTNTVMTCEVDEQKEFCTEFDTVTCAKLASCSDFKYQECISTMSQNSKCMSAPLSEVSHCTQEFADIKCSQDLPEICQKLF